MALDPAGLNHANLLRHNAQYALVDFLLTDIDLAFTFIKIARTAKPDHAVDLIGRARKALGAVRHFSGRIKDPGLWNMIHQRGNELETAILLWKK